MKQFRIDHSTLGVEKHPFTLFVTTNGYQWQGVFAGSHDDCWVIALAYKQVGYKHDTTQQIVGLHNKKGT